MRVLLILFVVLSGCGPRAELEFQTSPDGALPQGSIEYRCDEDKSTCVSSVEIPEGFTHQWSQLFYDGQEEYLSFMKASDVDNLENAEFCLFKNGEELFCDEMNAGAAGPLEILRIDDYVEAIYWQKGDEGELMAKSRWL